MTGLSLLFRFFTFNCNARGKNKMISENREAKQGSKQAKHCELNGIKFDSMGERNFYIRLCRIFGSNNVVRGQRVNLIDSTEESPGLGWMPDFQIKHKGQPFTIEYKGCLRSEIQGTREFTLKWSVLHSLYSPLTTLRYLTFCDDGYIPKWSTEVGRRTLPSIFCSKNLTDKRIYELVDERFDLLNS